MHSKISTNITPAMDPHSPSRICSNAALQEQIHCPSVAVADFYNTMGRQIWLGNTLLLVSAAMAAIMVGIGGYGRRYQHHRFTRSIFLGANILFLPFISYVVSTLSDNSNDYADSHNDGTTLAADDEHDRVFRVIADELSFLNDYYYSSLPVHMEKQGRNQIQCEFWCTKLQACRWKIVNHWDETIGQCSVLALHPTARTTLFGHLRRLFHLPDKKTKVKLPTAVKVCIMDALRSAASSNGCHLGNGRTSLHRSQVGKSFLWACNGKSTSDIILTWHIATCILEVRHPLPISDKNKIAATHLSRYCAYLMTWSPELLPDEVAWCKDLYETVKEDAARVLATRAMTGPSTPEAEYHDLVQLLSEGSRHLVLKNGVWLGEQLVGLDEGGETAWAITAGFWAEMILFIAPSNNLKGHKKAIARGGELITLLWALLFHAGIVSKPGQTSSAATSDSDGGV
nr:unnamed protein product [Digitaria exilis]